jgi:nitrogen regulatory protein P-II 1
MKFNYVVAIVRTDDLESLEAKLQRLHVAGMTLTKVKGYGDYKNFFTSDWLSEHTKVEIFAEEAKVQMLLDALVDAAHSDVLGGGIVAVMPVQSFLHLRTGTEALPDPSS